MKLKLNKFQILNNGTTCNLMIWMNSNSLVTTCGPQSWVLPPSIDRLVTFIPPQIYMGKWHVCVCVEWMSCSKSIKCHRVKIDTAKLIQYCRNEHGNEHVSIKRWTIKRRGTRSPGWETLQFSKTLICQACKREVNSNPISKQKLNITSTYKQK